MLDIKFATNLPEQSFKDLQMRPAFSSTSVSSMEIMSWTDFILEKSCVQNSLTKENSAERCLPTKMLHDPLKSNVSNWTKISFVENKSFIKLQILCNIPHAY